jgi:ketosteroid isomerase-like protein
MNRLARTAVLAALTLAATAAEIGSSHAAPGDAADVQALIDTDKRQQHAYVARDWKALDEIFTDDYVLVLWNGTQRTKAEILKSAALPDSQWDINETSNWQVRIHGDLGIVVAELHQKGTSEGKPFDSVVKFSDTYVRENGQWRNVHAHASKSVPAEAKQGP